MKEIKVYGRSDDLIYFEGDVTSEDGHIYAGGVEYCDWRNADSRGYYFELSMGDEKITLCARYDGKWTIRRKNILGDSIEWITTENGYDNLRVIIPIYPPQCDEEVEVTVQRTCVDVKKGGRGDCFSF